MDEILGIKVSASAATPPGKIHACNCIGCCEKCKQCVTTPWHAETCSRIAALKRAEVQVIERAKERIYGG